MSRSFPGLFCVLVLVPGCYPSAAFVGSSVQALDCHSGEFEGELTVERSGSRKVKLVIEVLPGSVNVEDVTYVPKRATLKGKDNKQAAVHVRGRLADRCASGGVNLLASYPPAGSAGYVEVEPVLPVSAPAELQVSPDDGTFEYALTLQCCGPEGAGTFNVAVAGGEGTSKVAVEPSSVQCEGEEEHRITVRGTLAASQGTVNLTLEDGSTGATCRQSDAVRRPSK